LLAGAAQAADEPAHFDLSLSALGDNQHGHSYDLNAVLTPSKRWSLAAGGGSSDADTPGAALHGTSFNADVEVQMGAFGVQPGYSHWSDDDNFSSSVPQLSAWWKNPRVKLQLLLERPDFALDYQLRVLTQTTARHFEFSGTGVGAGLDWYGQRWSGYVTAMGYNYGDELTRARAIITNPNVQRFPRLALLSSSMATLTRGALKDRAAAGLQYDFTRTSLHADVTRVTDAIFATHSDSVGVGVEYYATGLLSVDLSGGVSHADGLSAASYASLTLRLHW
jgi:hypothetical protein